VIRLQFEQNDTQIALHFLIYIAPLTAVVIRQRWLLMVKKFKYDTTTNNIVVLLHLSQFIYLCTYCTI